VIKRIKAFMKIEYLFIKQNLLIMLQFRISYFMSILYEIAELSVALICYSIMFMHMDSIAGWTRNEVFFLAIYAYFVDITCTMFFIGMVSIPEYIRNGTLDLFLLKPINKQFLLTFRRPNAVQIIGFFGCIIYFTFYIYANHISCFRIGLFFVSMICSISSMYNVLLIVVSMSFWVVKIGDMWSIIYTFNNLGSKPLNIYPKIVRAILIFMIPSAIIINIPAQIMREPNIRILLLSVFVSVFIAIIGRCIFKAGLARYESACG